MDDLEQSISNLPKLNQPKEILSFRYNLMNSFSQLNRIIDVHFQRLQSVLKSMIVKFIIKNKKLIN